MTMLNECWVWNGSRDNKGYGRKRVRGDKSRPTHRMAYEWANGPIPPGMCDCHKCDNPPCCNPDHLFLGTQSDNIKDSLNKGRQPNAVKTTCPKGHPYDAANTYVYVSANRGPMRFGKLCNAIRLRKMRAKTEASPC